MNRKTLIQFAHLAKQIACFIRLFAGANYDLNCNSVCSPHCFIHLVRISSELPTGRLPAKNDSVELIVWGVLKLIVSSLQDFIDCVRDPQWSTADNWLGSWNDSAVKMKEHCLPLESSFNVCYLPKILNFTTDMTSKMSNLPAALQKLWNSSHSRPTLNC